MSEPSCVVCGEPTSDLDHGVPCCLPHQPLADLMRAADELVAQLGDGMPGYNVADAWLRLRAQVVARLAPPARKLQALDAFNEARARAYRSNTRAGSPRPNGLACPACGAELVDSAPEITLASNPPQKNVACRGCGFAGYRYA